MTEDEYYLHSLGEEFKKQVAERIEKTLAVSRSHLKSETEYNLTERKDCPIRAIRHQHGIIVFVKLGMEDSEYELEENWFLEQEMGEFLVVYRAAREFGCTLINFDEAIPETDAFETFSDW